MKQIWRFVVDIKDALYIGAQAAQLARKGRIEDAKELYHW